MKGDVNFDDLMLVMAVAVAVPLFLGLFPRNPVPSSVVEILGGIVVGPAVLGIVHVDTAVQVFADLGVAYLLFLAGLELDFTGLRGRPLKLALLGFAASLLLGLVLVVPLGAIGVVVNPLFIAITLSSTSLGIVLPVLKDAGELDTITGRVVVAACSVAEFGSIVVLSMFFSRSGHADPLTTALKLVVLGLAVLLVAFLAAGNRRYRNRIDDVLYRLQDSSAQLRVRIAMLLLIAMLVLADDLKFDTILGSFLAGALLSALTDPDRDAEFGLVRHKLEAIGFGLFVPVFFVTTGLRFPITSLFDDASTALRIPLFLGLLLAVRGIPALLLRRDIGDTQIGPAALLQATSLSFIVVATQLGVQLHEVRPVNGASLVAAGMLSVLLFPAGALAWLRRLRSGARAGPAAAAPP